MFVIKNWSEGTPELPVSAEVTSTLITLSKPITSQVLMMMGLLINGYTMQYIQWKQVVKFKVIQVFLVLCVFGTACAQILQIVMFSPDCVPEILPYCNIAASSIFNFLDWEISWTLGWMYGIRIWILFRDSTYQKYVSILFVIPVIYIGGSIMMQLGHPMIAIVEPRWVQWGYGMANIALVINELALHFGLIYIMNWGFLRKRMDALREECDFVTY